MLRTIQGVVASDKGDKTIKVVVNYQSRHPKYGKIIRQRTICYVHDEKNQSKIGDEVEIMESRPLSKTKRWELIKIVKSGSGVNSVAALSGEAIAVGKAE